MRRQMIHGMFLLLPSLVGAKEGPTLAAALNSTFIAEIDLLTVPVKRYGKEPWEFTLEPVKCRVIHVYKNSGRPFPRSFYLEFPWAVAKEGLSAESWHQKFREKESRPETLLQNLRGKPFIAFLDGNLSEGLRTYHQAHGWVVSSMRTRKALLRVLHGEFSREQLAHIPPRALHYLE